MKKALIVTTVSGFVPQFEMNNVHILQKMGYEVHYASNFHNPHYGTDNQRLKKTGIICHQVDFVRSPFQIRSNQRAYYQLKKILTYNKFLLLHCHTPMGGVLARLAARDQKNLCVFYTAHGFHFYHGAPIFNWLLYYPVERWLAHITDVLITINEEDYRRTKRFHLRRGGIVKLVRGVGIDFNKYRNKLVSFSKKRKELGVLDSDFLFVSVGELSKRKNHETLIRAFAKIKEKNVKLLICGKGPLENKLKRLIFEKALTNKVFILGYRTDIAEILQVSDCFVFPSLQEGLPVALLEACVSGLPVIASDIRGNRELVLHEKNGYLVSKDEQYAKYLKRMIRGDLKKSEISHENLSPLYEKKFVTRQMKQLYGRKKRILHLLRSSIYAGAEKIAVHIIEGLQDEFEFYYMSPYGEIQNVLEKKQVPYIPVSKLTMSSLKRVIKRIHPDIIHAHDYGASVLAASVAGDKIPILSQIHHSSNAYRNWRMKSILYTASLPKIKRILAVSPAIFEQTVFKTMVEKKTQVLENPLNKNEILSLAAGPFKKKYDLIYVGRFAKEKNPQGFIEIVKELYKRKMKIKAVMVGDGELYEKCSEKIYAEGLEKIIHLTGYQENPYSYMKHAKIFCMTSKEEGFGLAVAEALILEIPVLVTDTGNMRNLFGKDGPEICRTKKAFLNKIHRLLTNPDLYQQWKKRAADRKSIFQEHAQYLEKIKKIYMECLKNG